MPDSSATPLPVCFKAYDIRGRVPEELDETLAAAIGRAFAQHLQPRRVVVGCDIRLSSPALTAALCAALRQAGVEVLNLGLCGTEEVYFATAHTEADGGIMITASHNPADYNGMKLVGRGARPIAGDSGLKEIGILSARYARGRQPTSDGNRAEQTATTPSPEPLNGCRHVCKPAAVRAAYVQHLLGYVEPAKLKPLTIVANAGNGGAGAVVDALAAWLPFNFIRLQWQPDGRFPHGVPNPLLPENRAATAATVRQHGADLGLAWDGDFDRCFFFDENGNFIEGYYLVGLLAEAMLARQPGARIIHDPRLVWNTREIVEQAGGIPVAAPTGHALIKARMRAEDAVYGGEMSAHHYFRDFFYCDSGMIPWLLVSRLLSESGCSLGELVAARQLAFPVSGEINRRVADPAAAIARVRAWCGQFRGVFDQLDGLSFETADFRLNLRTSNTEPLLRLNVETRANPALLQQITNQALELIDQ